MKTIIRIIVGLSILAIIFAYKYYDLKPFCEPCLTESDCPPCVSDTQVLMLRLLILDLLVILAIVVIAVVKRNKKSK